MARATLQFKPGRITFDAGEPEKFVRDPKGEIAEDLTRRMRRVKFESRKLVRTRTGRLISSIEVQPPRSRKSSVYVDVTAGERGMKYTMIEHDGSAPHVIRARRRKALRFTLNGQVVFRRSVRHPGTTGTLYLTMALPYAAI